MDCRDIFKKLDLKGYAVANKNKLIKNDGSICKCIDVLPNSKHGYKLAVHAVERTIYGIEKLSVILDHDDIDLLQQLETELKKEHGI